MPLRRGAAGRVRTRGTGGRCSGMNAARRERLTGRDFRGRHPGGIAVTGHGPPPRIFPGSLGTIHPRAKRCTMGFSATVPGRKRTMFIPRPAPYPREGGECEARSIRLRRPPVYTSQSARCPGCLRVQGNSTALTVPGPRSFRNRLSISGAWISRVTKSWIGKLGSLRFLGTNNSRGIPASRS